jgi:hypothetical protein
MHTGTNAKPSIKKGLGQIPLPQARRSRLSVLIAAALLSMWPLAANAYVPGYPQGGTTQLLTLFREPFICYSKGLPVVFAFNYFLDDLATTNFFSTPTVITINPDSINRLLRLAPTAALFVVAHECGHARLLTVNEEDADCWAAGVGATQHWLGPADLPTIRTLLFAGDRGNATHPPGEVRANHIARCMQAALDGSPLVPM